MSTEINEANETQQSKKGGKAGKIIAVVLLSACLLASLGLNVYQAYAQRQYADTVGGFIDEQRDRWAEEEKQENEYIEDGFKVGGEYEIRSTTHISDAYKTGDDSQLSSEDKETLKMAKAVLDEVIEDGMSDYEKERAVYQWMVKNIGGSSRGVISRPGMRHSAFTPHDVLTSRNAVCVGYATTFRLFLNMMDIDVHIVHNEYHSWDLVKLDGEWYHVDIYSDSHGVMYANFNMTDAVCRNGHSWDESALPEAKSVKYSPAVQNGVEVDSLYDVPAALKQAMDSEDNSAIYFKFKTPLTDEDMGVADFLVEEIETMLHSGLLGDDNYYYMQAYWYPDEQGNDILGLLMEKDSFSEENPDIIDVDSPEGKKIIEALAEAFGLTPEDLGLYDDEENGIDFPIEESVEAVIGGVDGPVQVITTANGGSVVIP
ncbi:MAG: transglutaminase-like domain-containing protein [Oscillospiraceae bacterium]|nr:transglutaminase-like domain-containing protein [Oscillospiraceae bacterium]